MLAKILLCVSFAGYVAVEVVTNKLVSGFASYLWHFILQWSSFYHKPIQLISA